MTVPLPFEDTNPAPNSDRLIAAILSIGVIAVMLVALSFKVFELDRYFVPKELVLNAAALMLVAVAVARPRDVIFL